MKKPAERLVESPSRDARRARRRAFRVLLLLAACLAGGARAASAQQCPVYPTKTFTMTPGKPTAQEDLFSTGILRGTFTLIVHNGNAVDNARRVTGDQLVSSGNVVLNGVEVVSESELNQHVARVEKVVQLQASNRLVVTLKGGPNQSSDNPPFVTVTILRRIEESAGPVITLTQPTDGQIVASSPLTVSGSLADESDLGALTVNGQPVALSGANFSAQVPLTPGRNTITLVAIDCQGSPSTKTVQAVYDTLAPALDVTAPADGLLTKAGSVQVNGTATDDGQVTSVTVNGQPAPLSGGAFSVSVPLAEGANPINVVAADTTGKQTTRSLSATRDTAAPDLNVVAPAPGQILGSSPVTVTGTATDANGVTSVTVNGQPAPVTNGTFSAPAQLGPGPNTLTVTATDFAGGNTATKTVEVVHDTLPPVVTIGSPLAGLTTKAQAVQVTGTVTDDGAVASVTVNGQPATLDGGSFSATVTLAEGANQISVVATDSTGRQATAQVNATLDTVAPVINLTSPTAGQVLGATPATVAGTVTDSSGVTSLTVNGQPVPVVNGAFTTQLALGPGPNTVTVEALDFAGGNAATQTVQVVFDSAPPTVSITSPAPDFLTRDAMLQVSGIVTDDAGVTSVTVNGQPAAVEGSTFTASVTLAEGANPLMAVATDTTGKQATATVNVSLDTVPPTLNVLTPTPGQKVSGATVSVTGNVSDANGIASVTVNGQPASLAGVTFSYDLALAVGNNDIVVSATDQAGNVTTRNVTASRITTLDVTITSPAPQTLLSGATITVTGTADPGATSVEVNGVSASVGGGSFTASNVPLHEGNNILTATASNAAGSVGTSSVNVIRDSSAPVVLIDSPTEGAVLTTSSATVTGMVNDVVSGTVNAEQVSVTVNGVAATVANRSFVVPDLLLVRGANLLTAVARDPAGNESRTQVRITVQDTAGQQRILMVSGNNQSGVIGSTLTDPLVVQVVDAYGAPLAGKGVKFRVRRSDGLLRAAGAEEGQEIALQTDDNGQAAVQFQLGTRLGVGNNEVEVSSPGFAGEVIFAHNSTVGSPTTITGAMVMGESMRGPVGKPLPMPFQALVTDQGGNPVAGVPVTLSVTQGGGHLDGQTTRVVNTDGDGKVSTLLTLGPDAGVSNNAVTASFEGMVGDPLAFTASGVVPGAAADTRVSGVVLDNANQPIPGATAKIVGSELTAVSDAQGQFVIHNAPVGTVTLIVDGKTSPRSETFPFLAFQLLTIAGQDNTVGMPIFMPPLDTANSKTVGGSEDVTLTMKGVPGLAFTIFANSVTDEQGRRYVGPLSISQVHADKVPMPPPNGTSPKVVWTLQPAGLHFNKPIKVQLPNTDDLAPGQVVEVFSFDHALEQFVSGGMARVSADGSVIVSDPGFGLHVSGWGAPAPPPPPRSCASNCAERAAPCVIGYCDEGWCKFKPKPEGSRCDGGGCFTGVCDGAGKCARSDQQPDGTSCDDGNRCSINDTCGKDKRGDPACVGGDTDFVSHGCCYGKEFDVANECCIGRKTGVLPNRPNNVEKCQNPVQNDRPHEYDGCSVPQSVISVLGPPLGAFDKDNPAGGEHTRFSIRGMGLGDPAGPGGLACDLHDTCYQTCKPQLPGIGIDEEKQHACDDILHDKAVQTCMDPRNDRFVLVPHIPGIPPAPVSFVPEHLQARCLAFAETYTRVLKWKGGGAYRERQEQYCNCCVP